MGLRDYYNMRLVLGILAIGIPGILFFIAASLVVVIFTTIIPDVLYLIREEYRFRRLYEQVRSREYEHHIA